MRWFTTTASLTAALPLEWLALSPAYPPYLVFTNFAGGSPRLFWIGSGFTLVYALIALFLAATVLQRTWREGPETLTPQGWRKRWQSWARGSEVWRWRLRARLLPSDPFCWLAARDRRPALLALAFLGMAALLWLAGWAAAGRRWPGPANAFASSIFLHLGVDYVGNPDSCIPKDTPRLGGLFLRSSNCGRRLRRLQAAAHLAREARPRTPPDRLHPHPGARRQALQEMRMLKPAEKCCCDPANLH